MNIFSDRRTVEKRPSSVRRSPRRGLVQTSFLALAAAAPARAQLLDNRTVDPLGEIVDVRGDEEFQAVEQPAWRNAALTQSLSEGDLLRTGPYGGVGIAFEDRTQFRLHATSELKIGPLETTRRRFDLFKGRLWSRASRPDTPLTVRTPSANASIRGTDWYMEVLDDGSTRLSVLSGVVDFSNDEGALQVGSGESAIARRGLAPELEIVVESPDRPRWALKPRADWNGFLPKSDDSAKVNAHLDVIQAFDEVRFTDARATLDAYEARYSDDLASNLLYAYAELYGGRLDDAKARIDRARALDDDAVRPLLLDAQYALLAADDARLDETTAEAVKRAPNAPAVWLFRAQYLALAGGARVAEVQAALERAVALGGAASEPQLALGDFLLAQGRTQEALDAYDRAWAADPNDPAAVSGRAFAYVILERLDDAEALLQPFLAAGTTNPDILSAAGVVDLARARPDAAAAITGKVVAGNPGRPGATLLSGVAQWHAGRRAIGQDMVDNARRLDPNEAFTALVASVMAQDQFQAERAIEAARSAVDAVDRNRGAGRIILPASQEGRLDVGSAFRGLGLNEQAEFYTSSARSAFDANNAFAYGLIFPDDVARRSSVTQGLLLDPLSVSFPTMFSQFYRAERTNLTASASGTATSDGDYAATALFDVQGLTRGLGPSVAYAATITGERADGDVDNDTLTAFNANLRAGVQTGGAHAFLARINVDRRDEELPGSFGEIEFDDEEETLTVLADLGYVFSRERDDRLMVRVSGGYVEQDFLNPSAFGASLDPLSFSLATQLGLPTAVSLAARGLFDTPLSEPNAPLLAVGAPPDFAVTDPVGLDLLAFTDDLDPITAIDTSIELISAQTRKLKRYGAVETSVGVEYTRVSSTLTVSELALAPSGAGAVVDFAGAPDITTFDFGAAAPLDTEIENRTQVLQGHVHGLWNAGPGLTIEGGVFPTSRWRTIEGSGVDAPIDDNQTTVDPRLGVTLRRRGGQARFAVQRTRTPLAADTIAPLGVAGILPDRPNAIAAERIDSATVRLEGAVTERVFLVVEGEGQRLTDVSAGLAGQRTGVSAFFVEEAERISGAGALDVALGGGFGAALSYRYNKTEVTDRDPAEGAALPLIPNHEARVALTYVDPRFFTLGAAVDYVGARFVDAPNTVRLDDAIVASVTAAKESRERTWRLGARASVVVSDDNPQFPGLERERATFTLDFTRRW